MPGHLQAHQKGQGVCVPIQDLIETISGRLSASANVTSVYGEPITAEGKTLIPVARVGYGFGAGMGRENPERGGGGGGVGARPAGVIEVSAGGTRFIPTNAERQLAIAALVGFGLGWIYARLRH